MLTRILAWICGWAQILQGTIIILSLGRFYPGIFELLYKETIKIELKKLNPEMKEDFILFDSYDSIFALIVTVLFMVLCVAGVLYLNLITYF